MGITLGCGEPVEPGSAGKVEATEAGVVGGWAATAEQIFATVEVRRAGVATGFCSGALISRSLVVTAAHCVVVELDDGDVRPIDPGRLSIAAGHLIADEVEEHMLRSVSEVKVHDQYDHDFIMGRSRDGAGQGGIGSPNDLALLVLSDPYEDLPVAPLLTAERADELVRHGDVGFVAGYGVYDLEDGNSGDLYISDAVIDIIGPNEILTRPIDRVGDSCFGDSGGPLYVPTAYGDFLVGVVSRGRSDVGRDCGDGGVYTSLSAHLQWMAHAATGRFQPVLDSGNRDVSFLAEGTESLQAPKGGALRRVRGCGVGTAPLGGAPLSALVLLVGTILLARRLSRP